MNARAPPLPLDLLACRARGDDARRGVGRHRQDLEHLRALPAPPARARVRRARDPGRHVHQCGHCGAAHADPRPHRRDAPLRARWRGRPARRLRPPPRRRRSSRSPAARATTPWRGLKLALHSLDDAAIFTIHGFASRALADTPFAAGTAVCRRAPDRRQRDPAGRRQRLLAPAASPSDDLRSGACGVPDRPARFAGIVRAHRRAAHGEAACTAALSRRTRRRRRPTPRRSRDCYRAASALWHAHADGDRRTVRATARAARCTGTSTTRDSIAAGVSRLGPAGSARAIRWHRTRRTTSSIC